MATVFCEQPNGWHIWQDTYDLGQYHVVRPDNVLAEMKAYDHLDEAEARMRELMAVESKASEPKFTAPRGQFPNASVESKPGEVFIRYRPQEDMAWPEQVIILDPKTARALGPILSELPESQ